MDSVKQKDEMGTKRSALRNRKEYYFLSSEEEFCYLRWWEANFRRTDRTPLYCTVVCKWTAMLCFIGQWIPSDYHLWEVVQKIPARGSNPSCVRFGCMGVSDSSYPYIGYVVVNIEFPEKATGGSESLSVLALICPGPTSPDQTAVIIGTNASLFTCLAQLCKESTGTDIAHTLGI